MDLTNSHPGPLRWKIVILERDLLDWTAILIAASLPWSTSLVGIFVVVWILLLAPTIDLKRLSSVLKTAAGTFPVMLFLLALVGVFWSTAPWAARLHSVGPTAKLLVLPLLIYHFERSNRAMQVLLAFVASCALLLIMSWLVIFFPYLTIKPAVDYGVPVKNYIDQSQEFALCAIGLLYLFLPAIRQQRFLIAAAVGLLSLSFLVNLVYVVSSRTALVCVPFMLLALAKRQLKRTEFVSAVAAAVCLASILVLTSTALQQRITGSIEQYNRYETLNESTSVGMRLEFWRKSIGFFADSPIFGHGTGSIGSLFEAAAYGTGATAEVILNPHNQILNVAIQWGALGAILVLAMWSAHFSLFRGRDLLSCVGMLVVLQNFVSSLFNSHLFDFHEGWMFVLGVGVLGGAVQRGRKEHGSAPGFEKFSAPAWTWHMVRTAAMTAAVRQSGRNSEKQLEGKMTQRDA